MSKKTRNIVGFILSILGYILFFAGIVYRRTGLPDTTIVGLFVLAAGELLQNYRRGLSTKTKHMLLATAAYFVALVIADFLLPRDLDINTFVFVLFAAVIIGFWLLLLSTFSRMRRDAEAIDQMDETSLKND